MSIQDIESLDSAELKKQRDALVAAAEKEPTKVLAQRYVKAATSAKQRDEKLAEQGKTITALQEALDAVKAKEQEHAQLLQERALQIEQLQAEVATLTSKGQELVNELAGQTARADRLKTQASRHNTAVSSAAKILSDALAAQAIDAANLGE